MDSDSELYDYTPRPTTKYCFLTNCKNNSEVYGEKLFFSVPSRNRAEWCRAAGLARTRTTGALYICEDHLKLEEDMENYMYWKTMRKNRKVLAKLKPRLPESIRLPDSIHSPLLDSRECGPSKQLPSLITKNTNQLQHIAGAARSYLVHNKHTHVSLVPDCSTYSILKKENKEIRKSEAVPMFTEELVEEKSVPAILGSTSEVTTPLDELMSKQAGRKFTMKLIKKRPMTYIGLPKKHYFLIDFIAKRYKNVTTLSIITTLYKIRTNDTSRKIADLFEISVTTLWRYYYVTLNVLSHFFKQFIYWPPELLIKRNLPSAFRINNNAKIQGIIDCFEVEIEKPSNPIHQSLTWSQYKGCNTVKFLITATPDGFINYISAGYGGRISDVNLVEQCGFLQTVPSNCTILAGRGFKHLETVFSQKNIKVLRPPSVYSDTKPTTKDVLTTKVIASLRIHIECLKRRVRLFRLLKPHSTVNNKFVNSLDQVVNVACGLINLRCRIIKG